MNIKSLEPLISEHPLFRGLDESFISYVTGCAKNARFRAGEVIFSEGQPADWFYLVRSGQVALEVQVPSRGPVVVQTVHDGEILGLSWLVPPYKWSLGARAVEPTRAVVMSAECLRNKCDEDPALGFALLKRMASVMTERLQATRLRVLDVYGNTRSA